jgi:fructose-bisphosphate aldolase class 1
MIARLQRLYRRLRKRATFSTRLAQARAVILHKQRSLKNGFDMTAEEHRQWNAAARRIIAQANRLIALHKRAGYN